MTGSYNAIFGLPPGPISSVSEIKGFPSGMGVSLPSGISVFRTISSGSSSLTLDPNCVAVLLIAIGGGAGGNSASSGGGGGGGECAHVFLVPGKSGPRNIYWTIGAAAAVNSAGSNTTITYPGMLDKPLMATGGQPGASGTGGIGGTSAASTRISFATYYAGGAGGNGGGAGGGGSGGLTSVGATASTDSTGDGGGGGSKSDEGDNGGGGGGHGCPGGASTRNNVGTTANRVGNSVKTSTSCFALGEGGGYQGANWTGRNLGAGGPGGGGGGGAGALGNGGGTGGIGAVGIIQIIAAPV